MNTRYSRVAIVAGLLTIMAILLTISVTSSDTTTPELNNSAIASVTPTPGGLQRPQSDISVDLADGFVGRLVIDGTTIPDDEVIAVPSQGQYTFRPGPGKAIEEFEANTYSAQVFYWPAGEPEPPSAQSYTWSFRVTS